MSSKHNNAAASVIGIDIGKNSFHVVGQDHGGTIVLRQKWSRGQVEARLANLPPCLIGMEACVGAHHSRLHNYPPRWNAAPSQELLVIRRNRRTGEVSLDPLRWGPDPALVHGPEGGRKPINA